MEECLPEFKRANIMERESDMSFDFMMRKEDMDKYLNELAKELKIRGGRNAHFEIVIAGGASIVQNYTFRQMSSGINATDQ
ncbi:MAG: hypothetical protein ACLU48_01980 [Clostridiaceae bacterium]